MEIFNRRSSRCIWSSLIIATCVLCFAFVYVSFFAGHNYGSLVSSFALFSSEKLTEEECISVCDTRECVHQSKILLDNVQETAEPCEDFYKFTCGGFLEKRDPHEASTFVTRHLSRMKNRLKNLLDNLEPSPGSPSSKVKTVYDSCIKHGSSEIRAIPDFLQILSSFGIRGWPHLAPDYKFAESGIAEVVANLLLYEEYGFIYFTEDPLDRGERGSKINLTLGIADSHYEKLDENLRQHKLYLILKYFMLDTEAIHEIWEDSEAILNAMKILKAESEKIHEQDENATYSCRGCLSCIMDVENERKDLCVSLESFISILGMDEKFNKNQANIYGSDIYFMKNVFPVLRNFTDRSVANYLVLNVLLSHLNDLSFYFRLIYQDFPSAHNVLYDLHEPINRWEHCVQWIYSHIGFALAYEMIEREFSVSMLQEVQNLTRELIQETKETVSRQEWISDIVLDDITDKIGNIFDSGQVYIEVGLNESLVSRFYEEFQPAEISFLQNVFEYKRFEQTQEMRGLHLKDMNSAAASLFMPGASGGDGELTINPGILFPPTYMHHLQRLINLASLGTIIAHEVGHNVQSFYVRAMELDKSGKDYYNEEQQCLNKQFSEFRLESIGKNLEGKKYSRENEADNMAVTIIDKLTEKYLANGEEISLPGLPYSTKQLLYISSAQSWCSVYTREKEELTYESGSHSPTMFRLLGMMQNSKGFSEAFSCPEGSYMNPSIKCLIFNND